MRKVVLMTGLLVAGMGAFPAGGAARPLEKELPFYQTACFMRDYDLAHLMQHPDQGVVQIMLNYEPDLSRGAPNIDDPFFVKLRIMVRSSTSVYELGGYCEAAERGGKGLHCEPEWDAGSFNITPGKEPGAVIVRNNRMVLNPTGRTGRGVVEGAIMLMGGDAEWELLPSTECKVRRPVVHPPSADLALPEPLHVPEPSPEPLSLPDPEPSPEPDSAQAPDAAPDEAELYKGAYKSRLPRR